MKKILLFGIIGILLLSMSRCVKDDMEIDSDKLFTYDRPINVAGPIATVNLKASDLFDRLGEGFKTNILIDDDGLLNTRFSDSIEILWDNIVRLNSVNLQEYYPIVIPPGSSSPAQSITFEERIKLNEDSQQRFDSMIIYSSTLYLNIQFPSELSGQVNLTFPEVTRNGQVLTVSYDSEISESYFDRDLEGYHVEFKQGVDSSYITVLITPDNIQAEGTSGGSYSLGIGLSLSNTIPEIVFGDFGSTNIADRNESVEILLFNDLRSYDMIEFKDIKLLMDFDNYYGIDYECTLQDAIISSSYSEDSLDLTFSGNNTLVVESADYETEIVPKFNSILFDSTNSNIRDAIHLFPNKMDFRLLVNSVPDNSGAIHFVTRQNKISGNFDVIIPIWFKCKAYNRTDTIHNFDVNNMFSDESMEFLDSVALTFDIQNRFPFDVNIQTYLADENNVIVDSIFNETQHFLVSRELDEYDRIVETGESKRVDISLTNSQIQSFKDNNVKKMFLSTRTITANEGNRFVKIFEDYGFEFKMSIYIKSEK